MEEKIKFEEGEIWLYKNGIPADWLGCYSRISEKVWKCAMFSFPPDIAIYEDSLQKLRSTILRWIGNREKGIKDLPEISEQIQRMHETAWEIAYKHCKPFSLEASNEVARALRFNLVDELKKRGYWMYGKSLLRREVYDAS